MHYHVCCNYILNIKINIIDHTLVIIDCQGDNKKNPFFMSQEKVEVEGCLYC